MTKEEVHNKSLDLSYFESNEILRVNITNSTISTNQSNATATTMMHYTLTGLDSHKNYTIYVAGNTRKGHGALGTPIYVQTDQDGKKLIIFIEIQPKNFCQFPLFSIFCIQYAA